MTTREFRPLTQTEILCIKRNRANNKSFEDIADRLSIPVEVVKKVWKIIKPSKK